MNTNIQSSKAIALSKAKDELEANKKNAYGYIRVSDVSQIERSSLSNQYKSIIKYCEDNNLDLLDVFRDEGKSGMSTNGRDGFLDLMKTVKPGNFVIVYELSRFARDQQDTINNFRDLVRNKGCTFICLNPFIDSRTPQADMMIGIMSTIAQEESNRTSIRVKSNMQRLSEEGKLVCRPPFGYIHDPSTRRYVPDEPQQEIVRKLQIWHLNKVSMTEMAKRLNNDGLGPVLNNNKKKKNPDAKFTASTIGIILRGYGFIKDDKSPSFTHPERIETWNNSLHKVKIKHNDESQQEENNSNSNVSTDHIPISNMPDGSPYYVIQ